jgi:paraquat-inducible protein A
MTDTACIACDLLIATPSLAAGQRATCPRCGHHLMAVPKDGLNRSLAFAMGGAVFLAASLIFPFLSLQVGGVENVMTLPQSALELYRNGMVVLSGLVLGFILLVPTVILAAVLALLAPLVRGRNAPWLVPAGRLIFSLSSWSMVEVFVIGVVVSLVKLAAMATIVLGISFWSYAAFGICLTATLGSLDRVYVWDAIERVSRA